MYCPRLRAHKKFLLSPICFKFPNSRNFFMLPTASSEPSEENAKIHNGIPITIACWRFFPEEGCECCSGFRIPHLNISTHGCTGKFFAIRREFQSSDYRAVLFFRIIVWIYEKNIERFARLRIPQTKLNYWNRCRLRFFHRAKRSSLKHLQEQTPIRVPCGHPLTGAQASNQG